jgi:hypothetical protein
MTIERGAKTRGRIARAMSGADAIEIKATIPDRQVTAALSRYGLTPRNDEERYVYFFDTPTLDLLEAGIIVRARRVVGDTHDSTVKFRPVNPATVGDEWRKFRDFKIEADASEKGMVKSASFSMPAEKGLIKRVAAGTRPIRDILTREQRAFIETTAGGKIDLDRLVVLGPLKAHRWSFEDAGCPWPITAELWIREDGDRMLEVSIKAPAVQAAAAIGGFMAFLAEAGVDRDNDQKSKTRWALSYYATKHAGGAGRPASAKVKAGTAGAKRSTKAATGPGPRGASRGKSATSPRKG